MTNATVPGYLFAGGMTVGLGWVLGIVPLESRFLWDEYNDALAEAYSNSELTARSLTELSTKFDAIDTLSKKSNKVCGDIAGLNKTYTSQYEKQYSGRLGEFIKLQDRSGFLEKYKNFDPLDWVSAAVRLPDHKPFQDDCFSNPVDIPASAAQAGAILDRVIAEQEQRLSKVQNARNSYERLLMSGGVLDIRCNSGGRANNFVYTSRCGDEAEFGDEGFVSKPLIAFTITGRDFDNVMPRAYSYTDSNIGIELKNNVVQIHNRTNKYVSIEAISLYFNDRVLTRSKADSALYDLPPGTREKFYLSKFDLDSLPNDPRNLTVSEAGQRTIEFALSAKYRITEIDYSKTLHKVETYRLANLLQPE